MTETIQREIRFSPVYENRQKGVSQTGVKHSFVEQIFDDGKMWMSILHTCDNEAEATKERERLVAERGEVRTIVIDKRHGGSIEQVAGKMAKAAKEAVE
jgi:hypothetical protein